ncbi:MAG: N-acetylmuramoyl-L-alanine amidase [Nanoarchaeota archaeon]
MRTSRDFRQLQKAIGITAALFLGLKGVNCAYHSLSRSPVEQWHQRERASEVSPTVTPTLPDSPIIDDPLNYPPYTDYSADEPETSFGLEANVPISALTQEIKKKIVLDAGHGMGNRTRKVYDPGAVRGAIQEADLNLIYAQEAGRLLTEKGYEVIQTRIDDKTEVSLDKRTSIANDANADLFVSVHCNASTSENSRGVIVFYYPKSERGESAAISVREGLVKILDEGVEDFDCSLGGIRGEEFYVLKRTKMPSILIEAGFLTNDNDRNYLIDNKWDIARGIADGIDNYFKGKN